MKPAGTPLRLATRGSPLARWQTHRVAELLGRKGTPTTVVVVDTEGDRRADVPLRSIGGQGVFVKEVQAAVVRGEADAAVHSAKDLPSAPELLVPGLVLAAFPERADPHDLLVGATLDTLGSGALVATGSARRRVQLANLRADLVFADLRGNLATRLAAVGTAGVGAVVVAVAGVERLGWENEAGLPVERLGPLTMVPQVGQGAIAVECREDDHAVREALAAIDDPWVRRPVEAERAYLAELGGGCTQPVGALAVACEDAGVPAGSLTVTGMLASEDGHVVLRRMGTGTDPGHLGRSVARALLDRSGGRSLGAWGAGDEAVRPGGRPQP
jgi:hydroxymethylbilane synthase